MAADVLVTTYALDDQTAIKMLVDTIDIVSDGTGVFFRPNVANHSRGINQSLGYSRGLLKKFEFQV